VSNDIRSFIPLKLCSATIIALFIVYFETSVNWQVALTLQNSSLDVVPLVCLAAKTEMTLVTALRSFNNLQDRCRATILRHLANTVGTIDRLPVPRLMKNYIGELADVGGVEHSFRLERQHINCANRQSTTNDIVRRGCVSKTGRKK
jgi:hypothetical protein